MVVIVNAEPRLRKTCEERGLQFLPNYSHEHSRHGLSTKETYDCALESPKTIENGEHLGVGILILLDLDGDIRVLKVFTDLVLLDTAGFLGGDEEGAVLVD